jgi:hypothetical protein
VFSLFRFDLPDAVTKSLLVELDRISGSKLDSTNLYQLQAFQEKHEINHGVYLLLQNGTPVYVGKADNVYDRLQQHWEKLTGRRDLEINSIEFKALILEVSWSTSANEELLIDHYQGKDQCKWNHKGFGPKDPGKNRDGHTPGWFDETYPINEDWPIDDVEDEVSVGVLLKILKESTPYLIRYTINSPDTDLRLNLAGVDRTAKALLIATAKSLGANWQLMLFKSHFTLYKHERIRQYPNGEQLHP